MLGQVTKDLVVEFLHWLEHERRFSAAAGNVRMAAHSRRCRQIHREAVVPLFRSQHSTLAGYPESVHTVRATELGVALVIVRQRACVQEIIDRTPTWSASTRPVP